MNIETIKNRASFSKIKGVCYQLINQFLLFQYLCIYNSVKRDRTEGRFPGQLDV